MTKKKKQVHSEPHKISKDGCQDYPNCVGCPYIRRGCDIIRPGDLYEDCSYHPVLCTRVIKDGNIDTTYEGLSLVDGSFPRSCSARHCKPRKITLRQAINIRFNGPSAAKKRHIQNLIKNAGWWFNRWWK